MFGIAVTGLARSGKDAVADYLVERYGFRKLVLSEVLAAELEKQGRPDSKMERSMLGVEIRKMQGKDVLARKVLETARREKFERAIFSGIQSVAEVEFLKSNLERFTLIAVEAGEENRFQRKTQSDPQSRADFFARDRHNLEKFDLKAVIEGADHTIPNNSTLDDLHRAIDELMQNI
ncbi:MAG: AAA family ATPase [Candidatus Diapherotrites archaeon]|uniref:AAA family ATPase n=1 Tax=Candidatus Iainarchaeum sp. TaxID=3101447 RepID=A0A939C5Z6_9ARCH|nr:AAA family ATPase [Candidatus Diapherotrites archaeon]